MELPEEIAAWVNEYGRVPFRDKGRGLDGWDCWGCYRYAMHAQTGLLLPSYEGAYENTLDVAGVSEAIAKARDEEWREIRAEERGLFDLILIRMRSAELHIAMALSRSLMLHAMEGVDTVVEKYRGLRWKHRILGFYRHGSR